MYYWDRGMAVERHSFCSTTSRVKSKAEGENHRADDFSGPFQLWNIWILASCSQTLDNNLSSDSTHAPVWQWLWWRRVTWLALLHGSGNIYGPLRRGIRNIYLIKVLWTLWFWELLDWDFHHELTNPSFCRPDHHQFQSFWPQAASGWGFIMTASLLQQSSVPFLVNF